MLIGAVNTPAELSVVRMTGLHDPSMASKYASVDSPVITKYPVLLDAMKEADKRYEEFLFFCPNGSCGPVASPQPYDRPLPVFKISADVANAIISDPNLNFEKKSPELYATNIRLGNAVYSISITGL